MKIFQDLMKFWPSSNRLLIAGVISTLFFFFGVLTLSDYGISWDSPIHFRRGQAYLNFFLNGKKDYSNLSGRRSFYQDDLYSFTSPIHMEAGHPPVNDIASSVFNFIFYQKLGLLGDIESYNLFIVFVSALSVGLVFLFTSEIIGIFGGIAASLLTSGYPLFFGESHFNIKDLPLLFFFTLFIYLFYKGIRTRRNIYLYICGIVFGLGMGVKFNMVFAIPVVVLWIFYEVYKDRKFLAFLKSRKFILPILLLPFTSLAIIIASWPYLWGNVLNNFLEIVNFYKSVGSGNNFQQGFSFLGFNLYPIYWIITTTPPVIILFFFLGLISFRRLGKEEKSLYILALIWFGVTILRVVIPSTTIYGGVRQIMEYIPAMVIIAGIGMNQIKKLKFVKRLFPKGFIFEFIFILIIGSMLFMTNIKLHPNENVYFNFLSGGIAGAVQRKIPAAGNTFGNVYRQGVGWVNENLPRESKLTLIQGTTSNLPLFELRQDLKYSNYNFSGVKRGGEYIMEMTYNYETKSYYYAWDYVENFLNPIYEVRTDGVSLLKIWKNDLEHTKDEYRHPEKDLGYTFSNINGVWDLGQKERLSRVIFKEENSRNYFLPNIQGYVETSLDDLVWTREGDQLVFEQVGRKNEIKDGEVTHYFAAREARYIRIVPVSSNYDLKKVSIRVKVI